MARNEIEPLLTLDEVAEILRLKPGTIRHKVRRGEIRRVPNMPNVLRFRRSDIERLIGTSDDEAA